MMNEASACRGSRGNRATGSESFTHAKASKILLCKKQFLSRCKPIWAHRLSRRRYWGCPGRIEEGLRGGDGGRGERNAFVRMDARFRD